MNKDNTEDTSHNNFQCIDILITYYMFLIRH